MRNRDGHHGLQRVVYIFTVDDIAADQYDDKRKSQAEIVPDNVVGKLLVGHNIAVERGLEDGQRRYEKYGDDASPQNAASL